MLQIILVIAFCLGSLVSDCYGEEKVVYRYKSEETIDFSDFSLNGQIIAPADLSLKLRDGEDISFEYPTRKSFDDRIMSDLQKLK